jgi:hypothetical protein
MYWSAMSIMKPGRSTNEDVPSDFEISSTPFTNAFVCGESAVRLVFFLVKVLDSNDPHSFPVWCVVNTIFVIGKKLGR